MLLIFLDTETSGLNSQKHRTLEIAYQIFDPLSNRTLIRYESIVSQPPEIWAEADIKSLEVNGFTWEKTLLGKTEKVVAAEIIEEFTALNLGEKEAVFVCQNPSFDRIFFTQLISSDLQEHYRWPYHWLDLASMYLASRLIKEGAITYQLKERDLSKNMIATHFGLPTESTPHRAMHGVMHLMACYKALFPFHD